MTVGHAFDTVSFHFELSTRWLPNLSGGGPDSHEGRTRRFDNAAANSCKLRPIFSTSVTLLWRVIRGYLCTGCEALAGPLIPVTG